MYALGKEDHHSKVKLEGPLLRNRVSIEPNLELEHAVVNVYSICICWIETNINGNGQWRQEIFKNFRAICIFTMYCHPEL